MTRRRADRIPGISGYKGLLTVPCQISEIYHGRFLVDTGATLTVISQRFAHEMKLDIVPPIRQIQIASAHQVAQTPLVRLDSLQVGDKKVNHLEVLIIDLPVALRVDGLLGVNFLDKFRVTFEFDQATLVLR
ncbi:retropepsin-like aspartic protease [Candidatus Marithioploca araucensis]|uniref:Retropepsin-like aspartic protease n=1 Tax=Candidatus Marithioploca araucensis TaxID=70273 RepID=A0ABT7VVV3_9GAMM|nr:retropepsin-like aspartic protease [Candidatus Marithioploca araucensis]